MEKIKQFMESNKGKDIMIVFIIILVGIASFMLGRLSNKQENANLPLSLIDKGSQVGETLKVNENINNLNNLEKKENYYEFKEIDLTGRNYFASKRGKKYYPFGCSAGKSIKEENKIYFNTKEEAEGRGYTLSSSCN